MGYVYDAEGPYTYHKGMLRIWNTCCRHSHNIIAVIELICSFYGYMMNECGLLLKFLFSRKSTVEVVIHNDLETLGCCTTHLYLVFGRYCPQHRKLLFLIFWNKDDA